MIHVNGIDVSDWQPNIDWPAVKAAGFSFAYSKATEGAGNVQTTLSGNAEKVRAAGMLFGAYHFFDWNADATAQAAHFLNAYEHKSGDLPPMLDLEGSPNASATTCVTLISEFLESVEKAVGKRCLLYMNYYFWRDNLDSTSGFSGHPLWLADYTNASVPIAMPAAWTKLTMWQYSQQGSVPGIDGNVDLDRFIGTIDELKAMVI